MILTVTLNPCVDLLLGVQGLHPFDTNRVTSREEDAGGKGTNLSRVAAELGAKTTACCFLGGGAGAHVLRILEDQGVTPAVIKTECETRINVSVQDGTDKPPTTFNMKGGPVLDEEWREMILTVADLANDADWVCMGGSLPTGVPEDAWRTLIRTLKSKKARILLDADNDPMKLGMEAGPHLIKPNIKEAGRLLSREIPGVLAAGEAAEELRLRLESNGAQDASVVLSMGAEGAVAATPQGRWLVPAIPIQAKSTIGSGDSMLGGILAAFQAGHGWEEALRWGSAAGAATAMTDGTEIARKSVFHKLLPQASLTRMA